MSNDKRNFALREPDGTEDSVFTGSTPRQAAMKAARRLPPANSKEAATPETIRIREHGTSKLHVYTAYAWTEAAPEEAPDWLDDEVTEANVSKEGVTHIDM